MHKRNRTEGTYRNDLQHTLGQDFFHWILFLPYQSPLTSGRSPDNIGRAPLGPLTKSGKEKNWNRIVTLHLLCGHSLHLTVHHEAKLSTLLEVGVYNVNRYFNSADGYNFKDSAKNRFKEAAMMASYQNILGEILKNAGLVLAWYMPSTHKMKEFAYLFH